MMILRKHLLLNKRRLNNWLHWLLRSLAVWNLLLVVLSLRVALHLLIVSVVRATSLLWLLVFLGVKNKSLKHLEDLRLIEHIEINVVYWLLSLEILVILNVSLLLLLNFPQFFNLVEIDEQVLAVQR